MNGESRNLGVSVGRMLNGPLVNRKRHADAPPLRVRDLGLDEQDLVAEVRSCGQYGYAFRRYRTYRTDYL